MTLAVSTTLMVVAIGWVALLALLIGWLWIRGRHRAETDVWASSDFTERRSTGDRRRVNLGPPPGMRERRSGFERRRRLTIARP
jgi:hypothetical protein